MTVALFVATALTAVFTGIAAVVAVLVYRRDRRHLAIWAGTGVLGRSGTEWAPASGGNGIDVMITNVSNHSFVLNELGLWAWRSEWHRRLRRQRRTLPVHNPSPVARLLPHDEPLHTAVETVNLADVMATHPIIELWVHDFGTGRRYSARVRTVEGPRRRHNPKL